jgi:ribosomal protein S18 acetylase RimI-like enzyme
MMNQRMKGVDNAAFLTVADEKKILASGGAYFVHHNGELLGLGWMDDAKLLLVTSVKPGAGERIMHSLMSLVEGSDMTIEVASTNDRAIRLYEKLGFMKIREVVKWYKIV